MKRTEEYFYIYKMCENDVCYRQRSTSVNNKGNERDRGEKRYIHYNKNKNKTRLIPGDKTALAHEEINTKENVNGQI